MHAYREIRCSIHEEITEKITWVFEEFVSKKYLDKSRNRTLADDKNNDTGKCFKQSIDPFDIYACLKYLMFENTSDKPLHAFLKMVELINFIGFDTNSIR